MVPLGPSPLNQWRVDRERCDLTRPVVAPRPAEFAAAPQGLRIDLARTACLVVDMQNDFLAADGWFPRDRGVDPGFALALVPVLNRLLPGLRRAGVPVIWINWGIRADRLNLSPTVFHAGKRDGNGIGYGDPGAHGPVLVEGGWGTEVFPALETAPADIRVAKQRLSGFWDNALDSILRNLGATTLLFAGINLDRCVFATLTDASFLGYDCILVEDASATPSPPAVRDSILFLIRQLYGFTTRTDPLLEALR